MEVSSMNSRLVYDNAYKLLARTVGSQAADAARLTQSFVRSEVVALNNTAQYSMQTLVDQNNNAGTIFNTEKRIAKQDWFIVNSIGIFLALPTSATDAAYKLMTYPDPTILTTAGAAAAAYTLYNSQLKLTIDNNVVMPEWDVLKHLYIPRTQPASNADYTASGITTIADFDGACDGFYPVEPNLIFNGAANIEFLLNMPAAIATVQAGGFQRIVVIMRGVKAQNVTNVK